MHEIDFIHPPPPPREMKTLIYDGNNLAMRSVHAMAKTGLRADGVSTGPLVAFANSFSRHVIEEQPDRVVVCWDSGSSEYRLALDPEYKANRKAPDPDFDQTKRTSFGLIKEFLSLCGVMQVERVGYEADDLIAQYVHHSHGQRVILSSDKDFLQLLSINVEQVRFSAGGTETDRWTIQRVRDEYGCEPNVIPLAMALAGDSGDNVPGVPRFGMKTAIKTLAKHDWSLRDVIANEPRVAPYEDQVHKALALVDLRLANRHLLVPKLPPWEPTRLGSALFGDLVDFLQRYELESIKRRFFADQMWRAEAPTS